MSRKQFAVFGLGLSALLAAAPALAEWNYTFNYSRDCPSGMCGSSGTLANGTGTASWGLTLGASSTTRTVGTDASTTVAAQAWSDTGGLNNGTAGNAVSGTLNTAYLSAYGTSGLAVQNRDGQSVAAANRDGGSGTAIDGTEGVSPEHGMDNNERFDSILFSFATAVQLTKVGIGWSNGAGDGDISVLRYTGSGAPSLVGNSYSNLIASGWAFVGAYNTVDGDNAVNASAQSSKYWLVGAYNPIFGVGSCTACDILAPDYLKLISLAATTDGGTPRSVPEPGPLSLLGLATLAGMLARRGRAAGNTPPSAV